MGAEQNERPSNTFHAGRENPNPRIPAPAMEGTAISLLCPRESREHEEGALGTCGRWHVLSQQSLALLFQVLAVLHVLCGIVR